MEEFKNINEIEKFFEEAPLLSKGIIYGKALRESQRNETENKILRKMHQEGRGYHVLGIVGIYAVIEKNESAHADDYPFTAAYFDTEKDDWVLTHTFFDYFEGALLDAMGKMVEGANSKFAHYAYKMLKGNV